MHSQKTPAGIQSIEIGFGLLRSLMLAQRPLALSELAADNGMSSSKARGYLISFIRMGLVRQLPNATSYDLGVSALHLGLAALRRIDAVQIAKELLPSLHDKVGETVSLMVWGNGAPVVIDKIDGMTYFPFEVRLGSTTRLLTSAVGRVFLTYLTPSQCAASIRQERKENLLGVPAELDLDQVRQDVRSAGLASLENLLLQGFAAVACPIFDANASLAAVVNVIGPNATFDSSPKGKAARAIKEFAAEVSTTLAS